MFHILRAGCAGRSGLGGIRARIMIRQECIHGAGDPYSMPRGPARGPAFASVHKAAGMPTKRRWSIPLEFFYVYACSGVGGFGAAGCPAPGPGNAPPFEPCACPLDTVRLDRLNHPFTSWTPLGAGRLHAIGFGTAGAARPPQARARDFTGDGHVLRPNQGQTMNLEPGT